MKGKNFIIIGLGAASGFIGASGLFLYVILKSDEMRRALCQITADKVGRWLFGKEKKLHYGDRVSYRDYYRCKSGFYRDVDEFIFDTYEDAENTLGELSKVAERYGVANIADYYDLVGHAPVQSSYDDTRYGWTVRDLQQASIINPEGKSGFVLNLPKAYRI